jgi:hypothetical protein
VVDGAVEGDGQVLLPRRRLDLLLIRARPVSVQVEGPDNTARPSAIVTRICVFSKKLYGAIPDRRVDGDSQPLSGRGRLCAEPCDSFAAGDRIAREPHLPLRLRTYCMRGRRRSMPLGHSILPMKYAPLSCSGAAWSPTCRPWIR